MTTTAIACQGGGSHTAFTAGALKGLVRGLPDDHEIVGLSGTSGGAVCAVTAWFGLVEEGPDRAAALLDSLWESLAARSWIDRVVNDAGVRFASLGASGVPLPGFSPYHTPVSMEARRRLERVLEEHVDFDRIPGLASSHDQRLIVSAVDVTDGEFETFAGGDVTVDAVLASAAVPHLFRAVEIDGHAHWDGLFSRNPPVTDFLTEPDDVADKPDEIWVIQINPDGRDETPESLEEIADRRNELSGNLSLRQEVGFIERVNRWIDEGVVTSDRYKPVSVKWLRLDRDLPVASKLDRDPSFIDDLIDHGESAAAAFLADRSG